MAPPYGNGFPFFDPPRLNDISPDPRFLSPPYRMVPLMYTFSCFLLGNFKFTTAPPTPALHRHEGKVEAFLFTFRLPPEVLLYFRQSAPYWSLGNSPVSRGPVLPAFREPPSLLLDFPPPPRKVPPRRSRAFFFGTVLPSGTISPSSRYNGLFFHDERLVSVPVFFLLVPFSFQLRSIDPQVAVEVSPGSLLRSPYLALPSLTLFWMRSPGVPPKNSRSPPPPGF